MTDGWEPWPGDSALRPASVNPKPALQLRNHPESLTSPHHRPATPLDVVTPGDMEDRGSDSGTARLRPLPGRVPSLTSRVPTSGCQTQAWAAAGVPLPSKGRREAASSLPVPDQSWKPSGPRGSLQPRTSLPGCQLVPMGAGQRSTMWKGGAEDDPTLIASHERATERL